jgi:nanoRNase/pAp phosphatase (c-di-AMP/oligoRNAs hydrolase)
MERTDFILDNDIAMCVITDAEAYAFRTLYNPGPLILSELLMVKNVKVAIAIKTYPKRLTAAIRCTDGNPYANELAQNFGGGGHPYSAGFRIDSWDGNLSKVKSQITGILSKLLK